MMLSIKKSSERLNLILMENSMTPTEFAHTYDISKSALSNYLNGKSLIRRDKAESLGERLNIDPEWLMGGDVSRMPLLHDAADSGNASSDNSEASGESLISEGSHSFQLYRHDLVSGLTDEARAVLDAYLKAPENIQKAIRSLLELS